MKKALSVLLALMMLFTLFSCAGQTTGSSSSASPSAAATESVAPEESAVPSALEDVSANADEIGFFTSGVDPKSRDTYDISFAYLSSLLLFEKMTESFRGFADRLNVTITPTTSEGDVDKYVTNFEILAQQGTDGFIVVYDPATKDRITEVLEETGKPYIALFNSVRDENGNSQVPTIGLDQYAAGATTVQWMADNYKDRMGDIDTSKLGLISLTFSVSVDLNDRSVGAVDLFNKLYPGNEDQVFVADCATAASPFSADTGYDQVSTIIAANPEVEYWFVASCLEMYSQGAARAAEQLMLEDKMLVVDVGSDILCSEWDTGYNGAWASCLAISNYLYAAPTICGLVAMMDGVATPESLWSSVLEEGDTGAFYATASQMVTKDNYKDYFNGIAEAAGMPLPYAS